MRKLIRLVAALVLLLLTAMPALAQSGRLYYVDEGGRLDRAAIERAAQPLLNRGATVAIYAVESGEGAEFLQALEEDGLRQGSTLNADTIAIFVSFGDRYSEIRYGDRWNGALSTNNNAGAIQDGQLNSELAAGNFTDAFTSTLTAIDRAIANPPTVGGGTNVAVDFGPIAWCAGILALAFGVVPFAWRSFSQNRKAAQALAAARQSAEEARGKAGNAIADMGQAVRVAREKAEYDKLSYAPADVKQLTEWQTSAEAQFVKAQEQFDQLGEAMTAKQAPAEADYTTTAGQYIAVSTLVEQARALLAQAETRRAELDKLNEAAPGEVDQAKKALADVAERLGVLGGDASQAALIRRPIEALVARAESLLGEHRAADAMQAAAAASAAITELSATLARYADIREGISVGRSAAEKVVEQGYRIDAGLKAFNTSEGVLAQAARALEQGGPAAANKLLDQAEAARAEGVAQGSGLPVLRQNNEQRIEAVKQAGEQLEDYIEQGRKTFDIVDEFAESTWSDIRGNGSEAEAAAASAQEHWESAIERNTMEAQAFHEAAQDLTVAEQQIATARALIDTIIQRLKDLEAARAAAKEEISAARADIGKGWEYVRAHNPDVGADPEQVLNRAAALLEQANVELAKPQPDWLQIVKQAREANQLADQALAGAQSEVEAINKLRDQVMRAQQLATAEVQKIAQFAGLHSADLPPESGVRINALQSDVQLAYNAYLNIEKTEEHARVAALRDALDQYTALENKAEQLYNDVYAIFQQAEARRKRVEAEVDQAQKAIDRADRALREGSGIISPRSEGYAQLEDAIKTLRAIGEVHTEADMQRAIKTAQAARSAADRAEAFFREQIARHRREQDRGDVFAPVIISTGGSRRSSGGSWGGGSSRGSGSWGSGGSSGGRSWGGGGSSGGRSFGGGGSSGGKGW